jgi:5-methyltetrahydrofolate--homocysteine methyltransferase
MLIVAERINASRKAIREALERMDAAAIQAEATAQAQAGAHYIDLNGGTFPGREPDLLCWLVATVQQVTDRPLCLDSSDPAALAAALPLVKQSTPMLNSITLERGRFERVLPLAREFRAKVVALCQGEALASTAEQKVDTASRLIDRLTGAGIHPADVYVDPLVFPVATDSTSGKAAIVAIGEIMRRFPGAHTICGLTNVSHGLPARKLINRAFLICAMTAGLDAAILDPTDRELMAALMAAEAVLGRDDYCLGYLKAFRAGKLS